MPYKSRVVPIGDGLRPSLYDCRSVKVSSQVAFRITSGRSEGCKSAYPKFPVTRKPCFYPISSIYPSSFSCHSFSPPTLHLNPTQLTPLPTTSNTTPEAHTSTPPAPANASPWVPFKVIAPKIHRHPTPRHSRRRNGRLFHHCRSSLQPAEANRPGDGPIRPRLRGHQDSFEHAAGGTERGGAAVKLGSGPVDRDRSFCG